MAGILLPKRERTPGTRRASAGVFCREMHFACEQWVPAPRDEVFAFFSDAANLETITPPWLRFRIVTPAPIRIERGTVIEFRLRIHTVPVRWESVIAAWDPPREFVDEQRRGPYRRWRHTHTFVAERGGTTVRDSVEYDIPLAWLAGWLVERDVRRIFEYRRRALHERFAGR